MAIVFSNPQELNEEELIREGYIHHGVRRVKWDLTQKAFSGADNSIKRDINFITAKYKEQLSNVIDIKKMDGSKLSVLDMNDDTLQAILEEMANQMNEKVEKGLAQTTPRLDESFARLEGVARAASKTVFASEGIHDTQYQRLMESIAEALKLINSFDEEKWTKFLFEYTQLMKNRASIGSKNLEAEVAKLRQHNGIVKGINKKDFPTPMQQVMNLLANIPEAMAKSDKGSLTYTARQMTGSLNSIFDTTIGEFLAAMFSDIALEVDKEITSTLSKNTKTTGQERVKSLTGSGKMVDAKIDVSTNGVADISLKYAQEGELSYKISGSINSSVKWYTSKGTKLPDHISIQNISSYTSLLKKIFVGPYADYAIYNTLAFNNYNSAVKESNFRIMRSATIARYLTQFIAGSGQATSDYKKIDTAMFMLINGKFYPIFSILIAYVNEASKENNILTYGSGSAGKENLVYLNLTTVKNNWIGSKNKPNWEQALARSRATKEIIDKFSINISLNTKNLEQICRKYNVASV